MQRRHALRLLLALCTLVLLGGCRGSAVYRGWPGPPLTGAQTRPLLVVDIDDTVAPTPQGSLYALFPLWPSPPAPLPGAPEALHRLAEHYRLVFLTARTSLVSGGTLKWLDACGFPCAPVIFSRRILLGSGQHTAFKTCVLRDIRAQGQQIRWAVGDKVHDIRAYLSADAEAILLAEGPCDEDALLLRRCLPNFPSDHVISDPCRAWCKVEALIGASSPR